jgi:hypothetical protein
LIAASPTLVVIARTRSLRRSRSGSCPSPRRSPCGHGWQCRRAPGTTGCPNPLPCYRTVTVPGMGSAGSSSYTHMRMPMRITRARIRQAPWSRGQRKRETGYPKRANGNNGGFTGNQHYSSRHYSPSGGNGPGHVVALGTGGRAGHDGGRRQLPGHVPRQLPSRQRGPDHISPSRRRSCDFSTPPRSVSRW